MTRLRLSFLLVPIYCLLHLKLLRRRFDCDPKVHLMGTGFGRRIYAARFLWRFCFILFLFFVLV
jgi:hypothetical protein